MTLPTSGEIAQRAADFNIGLLEMYAFVARHNGLPIRSADVRDFVDQVSRLATRLGVDDTFVFGYIQAEGQVPGTNAQVVDWARVRQMMDTDGSPRRYPEAGEGFPPRHMRPIDTSMARPGTSQPASPDPFAGISGAINNLMGSIQDKPHLWIGGAAVLFWFNTRRRGRFF